LRSLASRIAPSSPAGSIIEEEETMRIGIIGAGNIGGTLARHFVRVGHELALANSRGPQTLQDFVRELGERAQALSVEEVARFGEVVVVSIPFGRYHELPSGSFEGTVVIDTNNYYPNRDGHFAELDADRTTSSELLQEHLLGARVVKAFNAIYWQHLRDLGRPADDPTRVGIPISGDDPEAKRSVAGLIDQIGFDAVDAGNLAQGGRKHQPGTDVYTSDLQTARLREALGVSY
jgi:predicted dinucleotide-binding enzyme